MPASVKRQLSDEGRKLMERAMSGTDGGDEAEVDAFYSAFANLGDLENACSTPVKRAIAVTPLVVPSSEGNDVRVEVANLAKSSVNASAIAGADAVLIVCSKAAKSSKIVGCVIVIVIVIRPPLNHLHQ